MRLVIQRVNHASVKVDGDVIGKIGKGLLIFLGVADGDTREMVDKYVKKLQGLRIFEDADGKLFPLTAALQDMEATFSTIIS